MDDEVHRNLLRSLSSAKGKPLGVYSTATYSIGLPRSPDHYLNLDNAEYSSNPKSGFEFIDDKLTFLHEVSHACHFLTTAYGMEHALSTLTAFSVMDRLSKADIVDVQDVLDLEMRFLDHQKLCDDIKPITHSSEFQVADKLNPFGIFHILPNSSGGSPKHRRARLFLTNHPIKETGWDASKIQLIECNTATLFEGFAIASEVTEIATLLPELINDSAVFARVCHGIFEERPDIYGASFIIYRYIFDLPFDNWYLMMKSLIDISLMTRPKVFEETFRSSRGLDGNTGFISPINTFIMACAAAQSVNPIQSNRAEQIQDFEVAVCDRLGIPPPWMMVWATLANAAPLVREIEGIYFQDAESECPPLSSVVAHIAALKMRGEMSLGFSGSFGSYNLSKRMFASLRGIISIFDLSTRAAERFTNINQMNNAVIGQIMTDILARKTTSSCPLASGRPFYCGAQLGSSVCAFGNPDHDAKMCPSLRMQKVMSIFYP